MGERVPSRRKIYAIVVYFFYFGGLRFIFLRVLTIVRCFKTSTLTRSTSCSPSSSPGTINISGPFSFLCHRPWKFPPPSRKSGQLRPERNTLPESYSLVISDPRNASIAVLHTARTQGAPPQPLRSFRLPFVTTASPRRLQSFKKRWRRWPSSHLGLGKSFPPCALLLPPTPTATDQDCRGSNPSF